MSILVVDDEELERELLRQIFEKDYNVIMASNGREAINQLNRHYEEIVVILLDLVMPVLNGYQVLQILKNNEVFSSIPVAMVTVNSDPSLEVSFYTMGALSVIHKPFAAQVVRKQVENIIEMYKDSLQLKMSLNEQLTKLNMFYDNLTDTVSNLVEFRDVESGEHIKRVKGMTKIMVEGYMELFPEAGITEEYKDIIVRASALHDIGKISIPDSILLKPGRLTDEEREIMNTHTTKGCEILKLLKDVQDDNQLKVSYEICRGHHERYDGNGYPDGLKGDEIPISAQLVAIADVYDALVSERVYKKPYSKEEACQMIVDGECGAFSPKIIKCFHHVRDQIEKFSDSCR